MTERPVCVMGHVDAIERELSHLDLNVRADGNDSFYGAAIANLRALLASLHRLLDARTTGEYPRLERPKRDTAKIDADET